jgi:hypothetical protein
VNVGPREWKRDKRTTAVDATERKRAAGRREGWRGSWRQGRGQTKLCEPGGQQASSRIGWRGQTRGGEKGKSDCTHKDAGVCLLPGRGQGVWRKGDVVARRLAMEPPNTLHETGLGTTASGSHVRKASAADWHARRVESAAHHAVRGTRAVRAAIDTHIPSSVLLCCCCCCCLVSPQHPRRPPK